MSLWLFIIIPISLFLCFWFGWLIYYLIKGKRFPERIGSTVKRESMFRRLFWDFPKQYWIDRFNADGNAFPLYGFHLITGEQGSGKTVTLAYLLNKYRKEYPLAVIRTNFNYLHQKDAITHWQDLIFKNNGEYGEIDVLDEVQNWFSSAQSKDFPPEMIQEITQQRKQRKMIFGTSQVFGRVAKPIREQVNFLYLPITILGCLTIVRVIKPTLDTDGMISKKRAVRMFFFVHTKEIRESFDTYKKIVQLANDGFAPRDYGTSISISAGTARGRQK